MIGSCFSENISSKLRHRKFNCCSNPFGILFDTLSIEQCLVDIVSQRKYDSQDLFLHNELYHSWSHHSDFSDTNSTVVLNKMNQTVASTHEELRSAKFMVITLGSAFSYYHVESQRFVANCHKVPQKDFEKRLISAERILESLQNSYNLISKINPEIQVILTISPVRHLRDGLIENNKSKARLIEATHHFIQNCNNAFYFPSYEIVIDLLRDYRFFDTDFAHPNYLATNIVFDFFKSSCIDTMCWEDMSVFYQLHLAMKHKPRNPETKAHRDFLNKQFHLACSLQEKFPGLNFQPEIEFFSNSN